jgi:hypothetical protein
MHYASSTPRTKTKGNILFTTKDKKKIKKMYLNFGGFRRCIMQQQPINKPQECAYL